MWYTICTFQGAYYGYKTDGVFVDQNDINNWVDQSKVNASPAPGDIRYVDISGPDGVPDGKVDPNYDRVPLGSRIPKYTFGLNIDFMLPFRPFSFSLILNCFVKLFTSIAFIKSPLYVLNNCKKSLQRNHLRLLRKDCLSCFCVSAIALLYRSILLQVYS